MATKKTIIRKVITPSSPLPEIKRVEKALAPVASEFLEEAAVVQESESKTSRAKRVCLFCQKKSIPTYTDLSVLRRFLTDRAKIVAKERSGVCSRHQRAVAKNIKYARHLALLPFVPAV